MIKTKNNVVHLPLVVTGCVLFTLLVVATLASTTIPMGLMLFDSRILRFNVAVFAFALTIGSILPVLTGYIIGDNSVKSKSKMSHHFNGMLFGLLAFWLITLLSVYTIIPVDMFTDARVRMLLVNLLPSVLVAILTTILAITHVRSHKAKQDIIEYKPFAVALIASVVTLPLWSLVNSLIANNVNLYSFVVLAIVVVLGVVSYTLLRKTRLSGYGKLAWSAVSVSVAFVAQYVLMLFVSAISTYLQPRQTMEYQSIERVVVLIIALVAWAIYWRIQAKALRSK